MMTLDYVQDPGHGWIAADMHRLQSLGIADTITPYSYRDGDAWIRRLPRFEVAQ